MPDDLPQDLLGPLTTPPTDGKRPRRHPRARLAGGLALVLVVGGVALGLSTAGDEGDRVGPLPTTAGAGPACHSSTAQQSVASAEIVREPPTEPSGAVIVGPTQTVGPDVVGTVGPAPTASPSIPPGATPTPDPALAGARDNASATPTPSPPPTASPSPGPTAPPADDGPCTLSCGEWFAYAPLNGPPPTLLADPGCGPLRERPCVVQVAPDGTTTCVPVPPPAGADPSVEEPSAASPTAAAPSAPTAGPDDTVPAVPPHPLQTTAYDCPAGCSHNPWRCPVKQACPAGLGVPGLVEHSTDQAAIPGTCPATVVPCPPSVGWGDDPAPVPSPVSSPIP